MGRNSCAIIAFFFLGEEHCRRSNLEPYGFLGLGLARVWSSVVLIGALVLTAHNGYFQGDCVYFFVSPAERFLVSRHRWPYASRHSSVLAAVVSVQRRARSLCVLARHLWLSSFLNVCPAPLLYLFSSVCEAGGALKSLSAAVRDERLHQEQGIFF